MLTINFEDVELSHVGFVHAWPDRMASELFEFAEHHGETAVIALPETPRQGIEGALAELVSIVLALFPAWLPKAHGIDSPAGAGEAVVVELARAEAGKSPLFGPVLERLARAALAGQRQLPLDDISREVVALECGKLVRVSYRAAYLIIILSASSKTMADAEVGRLEETAFWLADQVKCAVWIAGTSARRLLKIGLTFDRPAANESDGLSPQFAFSPAAPWVTPLTGRPNPFSRVEQRLEAHLAAQEWAAGRAWNCGWQANATRNGIRVDLMWHAERLVVELDGPDHLLPDKYAADRVRDRLLQLSGFAVLRFTNEEVSEDVALVASHIERLLRQRREAATT